MGRRGIRIWALGVVVTLAVALAACSDDDDRDITLVTDPPRTTSTSEGSTTTADSTTTTDPDAELKAEVEAAYLAQWASFVRIFAEPDAADPLIEATYTGEALDDILNVVTENLLDGYAIREPEDPEHWVVTVRDVSITSPTSATVVACVVNGLVLFLQETGEVIEDRVDTDIETAHMRREDGRWKVDSATYDTIEQGSGCEES